VAGGRSAVEHVERSGGIQIDVPAEAGYLYVVRMLVHTMAQRRDLDDERIEDLVLAVSEACTWVLNSRQDDGSEGAGGRPIQMRWLESDEVCSIQVTDTTGQTDVDAVADQEVPPDPGRAAQEGELSLPLVVALVDDVTSHSGPGGTTVEMIIRCGPWEGLPEPV
jgi:anti-sigma regulatory factor (Ser/Thr protein kinase)